MRQRIPCRPPAGEGVVVAGAEVGEVQTEAAVAQVTVCQTRTVRPFYTFRQVSKIVGEGGITHIIVF